MHHDVRRTQGTQEHERGEEVLVLVRERREEAQVSAAIRKARGQDARKIRASDVPRAYRSAIGRCADVDIGASSAPPPCRKLSEVCTPRSPRHNTEAERDASPCEALSEASLAGDTLSAYSMFIYDRGGEKVSFERVSGRTTRSCSCTAASPPS